MASINPGQAKRPVSTLSYGRPPTRSVCIRSWIAHTFLIFLSVALVAQIGRLAYIHEKLGPDLLKWSERRSCSTIPLPGRRGAIFDRRYRLMAGSHDSLTVYADPRNVPDHSVAAAQLAHVLNKPAGELLKLLEDPSSEAFVILHQQATEEQAARIRQMKIPGIGLRKDPARTYPMGTLAAHVLGFTHDDKNGLAGTEGIELTMDRFLKAKSGKRVVYRDVRRRPVYQKEEGYEPPQDGLHVVLTIDTAVQEALETQISQTVAKYKAESGLGIVMDPRNGEILAMACCPTYNPAESRSAKPDILRNRILTDPAEPGSVFKPFVMSAALGESVTRPTETIFCHNGLYETGKRRLHDHHPYGTLTVEQILTKSSNIGMAILGQRLGNMRMHETLVRFGFGRTTGIDLPGEGPGLLMPLKKWNSFSTTSVPMGQEIAITPIQLATAFSAIVNGGMLVQPRVVSAVIDQAGEVVEDHSTAKFRGRAISPEVAETMRGILVKVVNEGTGKPSQLAQWQAMGKTGTAQVPRRGHRGYEPNAYLASFMAAAPEKDTSVVVLIMIRKPDRGIGYYGGAVSAPAVKGVLETVLPYLEVPPDKTDAEAARIAMDHRTSGPGGD